MIIYCQTEKKNGVILLQRAWDFPLSFFFCVPESKIKLSYLSHLKLDFYIKLTVWVVVACPVLREWNVFLAFQFWLWKVFTPG